MKTKVIIVIDHLGLGGAQRQILEYFKNRDRESFEIKVVALDAKNDLLSKKIESIGVSVKFIPQSGFFDFRTLVMLRAFLKLEKPDIVHTYLFTSDLYGRLAARLAGVKKIISSVRNIDCWKKSHHLFVDKVLEKFTDTIIINAEMIRPFLVDKEKVPV